MILVRNELKPNIILMLCSKSLHQDHKTIYEEGMRAFKHFTIYGYDLPWDTVQFTTTAFYKLEKHHVLRKCEAMDFYDTQKFRSYCDKEFILGLARVRGAQIATKYAEAFELLRLIN